MNDGQQMITDRVVSTAERLEEYEDYDDIDFLEAKFTVSMDGTVREATAVLGTGGPHIEVDCHSGVVRGSWGGDTHSTHVRSDAVEQLAEVLTTRFEENVIA